MARYVACLSVVDHNDVFRRPFQPLSLVSCDDMAFSVDLACFRCNGAEAECSESCSASLPFFGTAFRRLDSSAVSAAGFV